MQLWFSHGQSKETPVLISVLYRSPMCKTYTQHMQRVVYQFKVQISIKSGIETNEALLLNPNLSSGAVGKY